MILYACRFYIEYINVLRLETVLILQTVQGVSFGGKGWVRFRVGGA